MEGAMIFTLSVLAIASILFVTGKVRSDLVAVGALLALLVSGILTPVDALSGFSNSVVIMMIGLFVVGGGILHTGLARMASQKLLVLAGTSETRLIIVIMLATGLVGAFISNTGTVAVMLPIVMSLAAGAGISPGRLLMPLAFASSIGGALTLIGTAPNLVIQDALVGAGFAPLSFFSFTPVGVIGLLTGLAGMLVLRRLLPSSKQANEEERTSRVQALARRYQLADSLFRVRVEPGAACIDQTLQQLALTQKYGLRVIELRRAREGGRGRAGGALTDGRASGERPGVGHAGAGHAGGGRTDAGRTGGKRSGGLASSLGLGRPSRFLKTSGQEMPGPDTRLLVGDVLYVNGPFEGVEQFTRDCGLTLLDEQQSEVASHAGPAYASVDVGIAEVVLTPNSTLIGRTVQEAGLRDKYRLNLLGIQRRRDYVLHHLKDEKLRFGDALLVQGAWTDLALLAREQTDVVVAGQPLEEQRKVTLDHKAPLAAGIMLLMVVLLVTEWLPAVGAVMLAAVLMVVCGCVRSMEEAYKTINWESVVLIAAMIPMSIAIEQTGAAALLANGLAGAVGQYGPLVLLAGVYLLTSLLTLFISNTACAVLLAPIALSAALQLGVSPYPFLFAVAVGASMCFASPFSTPPNALVMSAGRYTFGHYIKIGLPLQLVIGVVMVIVLPLIFPFQP